MVTTDQDPRAWKIAIALAVECGLDWGRWASGESRPVTMTCECGVVWHGNTHTRWRCYCSREHAEHVRTTPVPAPWDHDAYRADCARRGVEPGPMPALSHCEPLAFGWRVEIRRAGLSVLFFWGGDEIAAWYAADDIIRCWSQQNDTPHDNGTFARSVLVRIARLSTVAAEAMRHEGGT